MASGPALTTGSPTAPRVWRRKRRAGARQQLGHAERLDHIVVGTELEQAHLLLLARPHRQHDDRHRRPRAQALHDVGPVHVRQAEIEDDEVDELQGGDAQALGAGRGLVHHELVELEAGAQKPADLHLVVDDEGDWAAAYS